MIQGWWKQVAKQYLPARDSWIWEARRTSHIFAVAKYGWTFGRAGLEKFQAAEVAARHSGSSNMV